MSAAWAACPDRVEAFDDLQRVVEEGDLAAADLATQRAEESFRCGAVVTRDEVATYFLLDGALRSFRGDDDSLIESFRSAAGTSPELWLGFLGPVLQERFVEARGMPLAPAGIEVDPELVGYALFVDGTRVESLPFQTTEGLHVLQVVADEEVVLGRVLFVPADSTSVFEHDLPERQVEVEAPEVVEEVPTGRRATALFAAFGGSVGVGRALEGDTAGGFKTEGAVKVELPFELGVAMVRGRGWVRGAVKVAPFLTGQLLFSDGSGTGHGAYASVGGHLAGGWSRGELDLGIATGPSWPGRWQVRGVGSCGVSGALRLEGRVGANVLTERPLEPALELMMVFQPEI